MPSGPRAHEGSRVRIVGRVRGIGPACVKLSNGHTCNWPRPRRSARAKQKPRSKCFGDLLVAPTGVDPVTFRFSVERSTN